MGMAPTVAISVPVTDRAVYGGFHESRDRHWPETRLDSRKFVACVTLGTAAKVCSTNDLHDDRSGCTAFRSPFTKMHFGTCIQSRGHARRPAAPASATGAAVQRPARSRRLVA